MLKYTGRHMHVKKIRYVATSHFIFMDQSYFLDTCPICFFKIQQFLGLYCDLEWKPY